MSNSLEFYNSRLATHKSCYDIAVNAGDDKQMKFHAGEMQNIKKIIENIKSK